jgi:hypothetical protein
MLVFWVVTLCGLQLKMEAVCSSETLVSTFKSTWHYNPEDQHRHLHRRENLRSRIYLLYCICILWTICKSYRLRAMLERQNMKILMTQTIWIHSMRHPPHVACSEALDVALRYAEHISSSTGYYLKSGVTMWRQNVHHKRARKTDYFTDSV